MQLINIPLDRLSVASINMRHSKKAPDLGDILPSIRARGILVPLLVRPNGSPDTFEIVAGRRRYFAAQALGEERGESAEIPCAILEAGDDAGALEASLIENIAREAPHEVELWGSFTRLVREGRSAQEIGLTFGLDERQVRQILALGSLLPQIRELYRRADIDAASIRLLTMASKAQQKDWLELAADPAQHAPLGQRLKAWLFGGASIPTSHAIFDLEAFTGEIVSDLFGDERYFASADAFWEAQRAAVEQRRSAYLDAGWADALVMEPGSYFHNWEYEKTPKKKGGKVFIAIATRGEVVFHEGYLTNAEARRRSSGAGEKEAKTVRPELTGPLQNYLDLHRHAAVRVALLGFPQVALRLMTAHAIAGSSLFTVRADPRRPASEAVAESSESSASEARFDVRRREMLGLLDLDGESDTLIQRYGSHGGAGSTTAIFIKLLALGNEKVLDMIAVVMGEALESGSEVVEALGVKLGVDMSKAWAADDAFFALLRDREVLTAMVGELAGSDAAKANAGEKANALKAVIRDCLTGDNGREKVFGWVPAWMAFPPRAYTARGGVGTARKHGMIAALLDPSDGRAEVPLEGPETVSDQEGVVDQEAGEELVAEPA